MKYTVNTWTKIPRGFGWVYGQLKGSYEKRFKLGIKVMENIIEASK
jgi:hypothetical protein